MYKIFESIAGQRQPIASLELLRRRAATVRRWISLMRPPPTAYVLLTPDQKPPLPHPLGCAGAAPRRPVSGSLMKRKRTKSQGITYLIYVLFLRLLFVFGNIRVQFAGLRISNRRKHRHAFHRGNSPHGTAD